MDQNVDQPRNEDWALKNTTGGCSVHKDSVRDSNKSTAKCQKTNLHYVLFILGGWPYPEGEQIC